MSCGPIVELERVTPRPVVELDAVTSESDRKLDLMLKKYDLGVKSVN